MFCLQRFFHLIPAVWPKRMIGLPNLLQVWPIRSHDGEDPSSRSESAQQIANTIKTLGMACGEEPEWRLCKGVQGGQSGESEQSFAMFSIAS